MSDSARLEPCPKCGHTREDHNLTCVCNPTHYPLGCYHGISNRYQQTPSCPCTIANQRDRTAWGHAT